MADEERQEISNSAARTAAIRTAFDEIYELEKEIVEIHDEHIKPLKETRTKKWRNIKADLNIPRKVIDLEYRRYKAVRQAQEEADDPEARDNIVDALRELHLALHQGETLNWVAALEKGDF